MEKGREAPWEILGWPLTSIWGEVVCMLDACDPPLRMGCPETLCGLDHLLSILPIVVRKGGKWLLECTGHFCGQFSWPLTPF